MIETLCYRKSIPRCPFDLSRHSLADAIYRSQILHELMKGHLTEDVRGLISCRHCERNHPVHDLACTYVAGIFVHNA